MPLPSRRLVLAAAIVAGSIASIALGGGGCFALGSGSGSSNEGDPCEYDEDCYGPNECTQAFCVDGSCEVENLPSGTFIRSEPLADCSEVVCDGEGDLTFGPDDFDLPDDGVDCTSDSCVDGTPTFTPREVGAACGFNGLYLCRADTSCEPCEEVIDCKESGPGEPGNNDQATAYDLGTIDDDDGDGNKVCASLGDPADADWYKYSGTDSAGTVVDPYTIVTTDASARVCVYFECESGSPDFKCPPDASAKTAPLGQPGCCNRGELPIEFDCSGAVDDNATVWIRVDNPDALACVPYGLTFHY